jgi:hypothetical protein
MIAAVMAVGLAGTAQAVDVDVMFVIDQSGSMDDELSTLSTNISTFITGLTGSPDVDSLGVGLVTYEEARQGPGGNGSFCSSGSNEPCLRLWNPISTSADLTPIQTSLSTASANAFGGIEDPLFAVDSVLPGGALFNAANWRNNTVKSIVLITDEPGDDAADFSNAFGTGRAALGQELDAVNYLNNVITESNLFNTYDDYARPSGALFDIDEFTGSGADPVAFLNQFAQAKLDEITTGGTPTGGSNGNVIPLPAAGWLLLAGIGGLGVLRHRQKRAEA